MQYHWKRSIEKRKSHSLIFMMKILRCTCYLSAFGAAPESILAPTSKLYREPFNQSKDQSCLEEKRAAEVKLKAN